MSFSVRDAALEAPGRTALVLGERALSFGELAERVTARLEAPDIRDAARRNGAVPLVGATDLPTLEALYALLELRIPVALLHPRLTAVEQGALSRRVAAQSFDELRGEEHPLAVLFTSGTEGEPKGVVLSRRAFLASARASAANLGWTDDDRWLLALPVAHVGGLSVLIRCLLARRTVVVPEEVLAGTRLEPAGVARVVADARVTLLSLVPTQLEWLLAQEPPWSPPGHVRAVLLGGAAARPALLVRAAAASVPVLTTYGLTEACSQVTTQAYGTVNRGEHGAGAPVDGTEIRIHDGRIEVRGPTLFTRYEPASVPGAGPDGWFRTGDLGRLDDAGRLHVTGRTADLIVTGGENVAPAEVEAALEACPGVEAACVFGVPDDTWGELVAAAIVPGRAVSSPPAQSSAATGEDLAALAEWIRDHLPPHRRPRRVAFVDAFATTPAGKLDRRGTRARVTDVLEVLAGV